jgi:hypothetical protein
MLEGVDSNRIIVGAYVDRDGGVCPMLAAHRCGGRTDFRAFARAWDRFTGTGKSARRASERELRTLAAQLVASILEEDEKRTQLTRLDHPIRSAPQEAEQVTRIGSAWLLPFRDLEEYHRAIELALEEISASAPAERSGEPSLV